MYNALISFVFLFVKDPETVHQLSLVFLKIIGLPPLKWFITPFFEVRTPILSQKLFGLTFKNPVGLAAGFDKNGEAVPGLEALGFGFLEVGTVTTDSQKGNPRPRLFRLPRDQALINRMGFNNAGAEKMKYNLRSVRVRVPIGVSLGKLKTVVLTEAAEEYAKTFSALYKRGDYFAVNVSSPNTPKLRELQEKSFLLGILSHLNEYRNKENAKKPLLVKISPDLSNEAIDELIAVCKQADVDGIIAVNTTLSRDGLTQETSEDGGLSGEPLKKRATEVIRYIHARAPELPIIGVGGIFTAEDAYEKIKAGASVVQVYTGFIYGGPGVARKINSGVLRLLARDGFKSIAEAVGSDNRL